MKKLNTFYVHALSSYAIIFISHGPHAGQIISNSKVIQGKLTFKNLQVVILL